MQPCQEERRKAAEAEAAERERRLQVDRRLTLSPTCSESQGRSLLFTTLLGRVHQGRRSRSSRKGKAAAGGPAAYAKLSYMLRVSWLLVSAGNPCQEELRKAAEAEAAEKQRRLQVDRRRTLNPTCSEFRGRWFLLTILDRKNFARPRKQKQQKRKGGFRWTGGLQ